MDSVDGEAGVAGTTGGAGGGDGSRGPGLVASTNSMEKYDVVKIGIMKPPIFRVKIKKCVKFHHLVI